MPQRLYWWLFVMGIGFLFIMLSPTMTVDSTASIPLVVGGVAIAVLGGVMAWRASRNAKKGD